MEGQNKIPTIEEHLNSRQGVYFKKGYWNGLDEDDIASLIKIHIKAALEAGAKQADVYNDPLDTASAKVYKGVIDKNSILNAYPESNIK